MPLLGIVLLCLVGWVLISVVLGVVIGRAVKVADAHRRDQVLVHRLSEVPAPSDELSAHPVASHRAATSVRSVVDAPAATVSVAGAL